MSADPFAVLRLVLDPERLAVLGAAVAGPVDPVALAASLGVSRRRVLVAVGKLRAGGLLDSDLRLDRTVLQELMRSLPAAEGAAPWVVEGPWTPEEREVLARFFLGGRLAEIPASRGKRLLVLERLAQEFEPGRRYAEKAVNDVLRGFHGDYATLRRYMVDEGILSRDGGVYWRSGGRVDVAS